MRRDGHYGIAILFCTPFVLMLGLLDGVIFLVFGLMFSIGPNWELDLGMTKRRGIMHTIWFTIIMSGLVFAATFLLLDFVRIGFLEIAWFTPRILKPAQISVIAASGAFIGSCSHLIADSITVSGSKPTLQPLYPISLISVHIHAFGDTSKLNKSILRISVVILIIIYMVKFGFEPKYMQS